MISSLQAPPDHPDPQNDNIFTPNCQAKFPCLIDLERYNRANHQISDHECPTLLQVEVKQESKVHEVASGGNFGDRHISEEIRKSHLVIAGGYVLDYVFGRSARHLLDPDHPTTSRLHHIPTYDFISVIVPTFYQDVRD